jgi:hypothetical protein
MEIVFGEMDDTSPQARERYYELLRGMTVAQRGQLLSAVSKRVRDFAQAGIRHQFPDASEEELRVRMTVRLYGRSVALRLHGWAPEDAR